MGCKWTSNSQFKLYLDPDSLIWAGISKVEYGFDINGRYLMAADYTWNETTNSWDGNYKNVISYDSQNRENDHFAYRWSGSTSSWENYLKDEYFYDDSKDSTAAFYYKWNSPDSEWVSNGVSYTWHKTYSLNVSSNAISLPFEANVSTILKITSNVPWKAVSDQDWLTVSPDAGTTDADVTITLGSFLTKSTKSAKITLSGTKGLNEIITITVEDSTSIPTNTIDLKENQGMSVFPNPSPGQMHIILNEKFSTGYDVEIYDSKGALVQKLKKMSADNDFVVHIGDAAEGIYIIRAFNQNKSCQTRVIKK
jgi:hypothetical protein